MKNERRPLNDWERAECLALKAELDAFNACRPRRERLTQEDLAEILGTSQGNVSAHLTGKRALNIELAARMASILDISVARFSPRLAKEIDTIAKSSRAKAEDMGASPGETARALLGRVTPRSRKVVDRIIELDQQGRLADADVVLLEKLIERFGKAEQ